jgi:AraC-like DNA-binding protein
MKQELSSSQDSLTFDKPTAMYDILARSLLAQKYAEAFLDATGLSANLVPSHKPAQLFPFQGQEHPFCRLMVHFKTSCAACQHMHEQLQQQIADSLEPQTMICFAGLTEFAVPIVVHGEHVATLLGGQVFQRNPTHEEFTRLAQQLRSWKIDKDLPRIESAFFQTRVIPQKQFQAGVQLSTLFTKFLVEGMNRELLAACAQDRPDITTIKNFILAHASEPLRLRDVSEQLHVSAAYFSRLFKKASGIGFSEFLARIRVEKAKDFLANPDLLITEVADQAGFGSLSQFNRVFHRFAGCSPKEYRASLFPAGS